MKYFRSFRLDPINERLWRGGERIPLTPKAYAIARYLVEHAGQLVTKEELMEVVWPGMYVQEENLKSYILELRRALGDRAGNPSFIETQRGRGYRFIAAVTERAPAVHAPAADRILRHLSGRQAELKRLDNWFERATHGERQIVFITGEAGIGKTALTEAFLQQTSARLRLRAATGQCVESSREQEAYYPALEALGRLCREAGGQETVEALARFAPTWLVQFPALLTPESRQALQREILGATRERMLREICEAIEALTADTPLILALEDLHWADRSTLDLISALARRQEPARLMLLATYRPVEVALTRRPLKHLKQELLTRRLCRELPLEPLGKRAMADYLTARFAGKTIPDELAGLIHEQTDGRPLFMVSAVDHLLARGMLAENGAAVKLNATLDELRAAVPESLYRFIENQIEQLSAEEQETLSAASVAGVDFAAWAVAAGTGRDLLEVEERCERLAARQLMLRSAGIEDLPDGSASARYQFIHSLYRETLYRRCSPVARLRLHQRIGEAMERLWSDDAAQVASELARHFQEGRDRARAAQYLRLAAESAAGRYAWREAIANLDLALELAAKLPEAARAQTQIGTLEQLADVYTALGDRLQAVRSWERVAEMAAAAGEGEAEIRAWLRMSDELRWTDAERALELCERAAQISRDSSDEALRIDVEARVIHLRILLYGWRRELADKFIQGLEWLRRAGDLPRFVRNAALHVSTQIWSGDYRGVERLAAECLPLAEQMGDYLSLLNLGAYRSRALMELGQFGRALRIQRELGRITKRGGNTLDRAIGVVITAELYCEAFDYARASALCQSAAPVLRAAPTKIPLLLMTTGAAAEIELGNYDQAQAYLAELRELHEDARLPLAWSLKAPMHYCLSELRLAQGDIPAARREADHLSEISSGNADPAWRARAAQMSARVAIAEQDYARAESAISSALAIVAEIEAPLALWRVHETAAQLCDLTGRSAQAEDHRRIRNQTLLDLANSLDEGEPLRQSLMNSIQSRTELC